MPRRFNTAGPNDPARHPTISVLTRLPGARALIDEGSYFVLHAPRQWGKTTALLDLAAVLNREGGHVAAVLSLEPGASFTDPGAAELAILDSWRYDLAAYLPADVKLPRWPEAPPGNRIGAALSAWAQEAPRPLVVLLDAIDALPAEVRASVVHQLRAGKPRRPRAFPWSLGVAVLRGPHDDEGAPTSHALGVDGEAVSLPSFGRDDVAAIFAKVREAAGTEMLSGAVDKAFELTQGHPFLVNALAERLAELTQGQKQPIMAGDVERARDALLERRGGFLDELEGRIREARLRAVLEQITAGVTRDLPTEDVRTVIELGLVRRTSDGRLVLANPIFLGLVTRCLPGMVRSIFPPGQPPWVGPDGRLDPARLLDAFLGFWRRHGEELFSTAPYSELSPLVLTAFLHRVVTSGGMIEREYAIGRGRMDVCIRQGGEALAMVVKVRRDREADPVPDGIGQVDDALDRLGIDAGWLVVFDRRTGLPPVSQRLSSSKEKTPEGREIVVIRA
jgi:hypothetical protein